ncbi:MAG: M20/M25/M40 family metallo-hydrolase [Armatimonadetes bacterium]|nr:M20/M25/M40 family metallo-hydrolase [Armatimonadota bacterium]
MRTTEQIQGNLLKLLAVPSPSRKERGVAVVIEALFREMGLEPEFDGAGEQIEGNSGNLWVRIPGNQPGVPPLLLNAHMDTVTPCEGVQPQIRDGAIHSDGTTILGADDKTGVITIIEAVREILQSGMPHGDLEIIITVAEEIGLFGAFAVDASRLKAKHAFVFDGGVPIGTAVIAAPTQHNLNVVIRGKASHAGVHPEDGVSAIAIASAAVAQMRLGRIDEETTANVGTIHGGQATNIIPELVELQCEARSRNFDKLKAQVDHIKSLFEKCAEEGGGAAEVTITEKYQGYNLSTENLMCQAVREAAWQLDLEPVFKASGGGSDSNVFYQRGIDSLTVNCGMREVHTTNEHVFVDDVALSIRNAVALVQAFTRLTLQKD